jgi:hypothetical protein
MKHARPDYDRIQDPEGLIPDDEPVFLLRAQDRLAWHVVKIYAWTAELAGRPEIADLCREHANKMKAWPVKKTPDLPGISK